MVVLRILASVGRRSQEVFECSLSASSRSNEVSLSYSKLTARSRGIIGSDHRRSMRKTKVHFRIACEDTICALLHIARRVSRDITIVVQSHQDEGFDRFPASALEGLINAGIKCLYRGNISKTVIRYWVERWLTLVLSSIGDCASWRSHPGTKCAGTICFESIRRCVERPLAIILVTARGARRRTLFGSKPISLCV